MRKQRKTQRKTLKGIIGVGSIVKVTAKSSKYNGCVGVVEKWDYAYDGKSRNWNDSKFLTIQLDNGKRTRVKEKNVVQTTRDEFAVAIESPAVTEPLTRNSVGFSANFTFDGVPDEKINETIGQLRYYAVILGAESTNTSHHQYLST